MNKRALEIAMDQISSYGRMMGRLRTQMLRPPRNHRVYMSFARSNSGWFCRFHRDDLAKTPISRCFYFCNQDKLYDAAQRGNGLTSTALRHAFNEAIATGRGGVWLKLTEKQYSTLAQPQNRTAA